MSVLKTAEPVVARRSNKLAIGLFTLAVFWSAVLLFVLEPLFAKLILPLFGGSPSVWLTCMVFFQVSLLLGYYYSHVIAARLTKARIAIHLAGLMLSCLALPVAVRTELDPQSAAYHPSFLLLLMAVVSIGLPFFFLATSSPLLQRWFSHTNEPTAADPYFLYAASNAGSLLGLALYPLVLEPRLTLTRQSVAWSVAYLLFVVLIALCAVLAYRWRQTEADSAPQVAARPSRKEELLWVGLAFVPACLLYGVTSQLSIDFPPVPLLWVVPLGIYLLTFIIGFSPGFEGLRRLRRLLPTVIVGSAAVYAIGTGPTIYAITGFVKLILFFLIALGMHSELALRRPPSQYLTRFFLLVSLGGVVAGVLAGVIAPMAFPGYWEYPITLVIAAALLPAVSGIERKRIPKVLLWAPLIVIGIVAIATRIPGLQVPFQLRSAAFALVTLFAIRLPMRLTAIAVAVILMFTGHLGLAIRDTIFQGRSFYGVYQVAVDRGGDKNLHWLIHGTTLHGAQRLGSPFTSTPTYYAPTGPVIAIARENGAASVGVVGLGTGTTGCYAADGDTTTFFEIDPLVEKIARDQRYFTYLSQCPGAKKVVLGDARLTLANVPAQSFDVLIIDAFTSDAIPMHLLTREAFELYRQKLARGGVLMVHVSNRYIDLQPVVKGTAEYPEYTTLVLHSNPGGSEPNVGNFTSKWLMLAPADRAARFQRFGWRPATGKTIVWTDDSSSLVPVVAWDKLLNPETLLPESWRNTESDDATKK